MKCMCKSYFNFFYNSKNHKKITKYNDKGKEKARSNTYAGEK